jgi:hypothetical protein
VRLSTQSWFKESKPLKGDGHSSPPKNGSNTMITAR